MKLLFSTIALLVSIGCNDTYFIQPTSTIPTQVVTNNGGTVPISYKDRIEYRVVGNAQTATIRYGNTLDGISQITTTLPFSNTMEINANSVFLSLDVSSSNLFSVSPFLSAQIFVNGVLFREASSASTAPVLSVSGTFRH